MTNARIPVLATSFATCMVLMVAFLACVLLWAISHHPALHLLLPHILVGFPAVTATGIIVGLIGSLVVGNVLGATFAVFVQSMERACRTALSLASIKPSEPACPRSGRSWT